MVLIAPSQILLPPRVIKSETEKGSSPKFNLSEALVLADIRPWERLRWMVPVKVIGKF